MNCEDLPVPSSGRGGLKRIGKRGSGLTNLGIGMDWKPDLGATGFTYSSV